MTRTTHSPPSRVKSRASVSPAERRSDNGVLGSALVAFGANWLLHELGVGLDWEGVLAVTLLTLGLGMMGSPRGGHGHRLVVTGIALIFGMAAISSVGSVVGGIGVTTAHPLTLGDLKGEYRQLAGEYTVDLSDIDFTKDRTVEVKLVAGEMTVLVPDDVKLDIDVKMLMGDVKLDGREVASGVGIDHHYANFEGSKKTVHLDLEMVAGEVTVRKAGAA